MKRPLSSPLLWLLLVILGWLYVQAFRLGREEAELRVRTEAAEAELDRRDALGCR